MLQTYRARIVIVLAWVICFIIFWWAGALTGFPSWRMPSASLLTQASLWRGILALIVTAVALLICVGVGFLIAGGIRADAALFIASAGLMAMSIRGGTIGDLLRYSSGPGTYLILLLEAILLFGVLALGWQWQRWLHQWRQLPPDSARDGFNDSDEPLSQKFTATLAMALGMIVAMSLLCQSDAKAQVLCSVALSAFVGATIAHTLFPVRPGAWYWGGALLVAAVGYIVAYVWPDGWRIGLVGGQFAALARPLPLDYASAAPAGAILGYWISRQWSKSRQAAEEGEDAQAA